MPEYYTARVIKIQACKRIIVLFTTADTDNGGQFGMNDEYLIFMCKTR